MGKTNAAAVPYRKKSYHSTLVLARLVNASFAMEVRGGTPVTVVLAMAASL
jgi:hypothetical protein